MIYRVTWIENDGSISKQETTFSKYLAKEWHKAGTIAKEVGYIKDCVFEELKERMNRDILLYRLCPVHRIYDYCNSDTNFDCKDCIRVMNERLDEYDNHVIEQYKANTRLNDTIREIHDNVAREMYCKGIDDLTERLKDYFIIPHDARVIDMIAKQLKAGEKE